MRRRRMSASRRDARKGACPLMRGLLAPRSGVQAPSFWPRTGGLAALRPPAAVWQPSGLQSIRAACALVCDSSSCGGTVKMRPFGRAHPHTAPGAPTFSRLCAHHPLCRTLVKAGRPKPTASPMSLGFDAQLRGVPRPSACPGGTFDNSPTFQRWVGAPKPSQVPKGRLKRGPMSAVPSGLVRALYG